MDGGLVSLPATLPVIFNIIRHFWTIVKLKTPGEVNSPGGHGVLPGNNMLTGSSLSRYRLSCRPIRCPLRGDFLIRDLQLQSQNLLRCRVPAPGWAVARHFAAPADPGACRFHNRRIRDHNCYPGSAYRSSRGFERHPGFEALPGCPAVQTGCRIRSPLGQDHCC